MKKTRAFVATVLFCVLACSKPESATYSSSSAGIPVNAFQDKPLSYTVTSAKTGAFTTSTLPAWAAFDGATGILSGVPKKMSDTFVFTVTQATPTGPLALGPYQVLITGNPLKEYQWQLENTGQTAFASLPGTAGQDIHLSNTIQSGLSGAGVKVAISDSGVVWQHEGLIANILSGQSRNYYANYPVTNSWLGDPTPDFLSPDDAHGTAVASLALEKGWNNLGGRGVAPDASFAGFLFIQAQDSLSSYNLYTAGLLDQFAGSFDVFNYSWGDSQCYLSEYPSSFATKLSSGVTSQRGGLGSIYVIAAGNSYVGPITDCYSSGYSGNYYGNAGFSELTTTPYAIVVGAVNANGVASSYSSPGAGVFVSSPGGEFGLNAVLSSTPTAQEPALIAADYPYCGEGLKSFGAPFSSFDNGRGLNTGCKYTSTMNGTSGATPLVTGTVALLLQANPALTWRDVRYILAKTADVVDASVNPAHHPNLALDLATHVYEQGWVTNAANFHFQNFYGFGRINVDNAVAMAKAYTTVLGTYVETGFAANDSGTVSLAVPDNSAAGVTATMAVASTLTIEAVQLELTSNGCVGDLGVELTSPSGTKSILVNINNGLKDTAVTAHKFLSNAFYGEADHGTWTLKVLDAHAGCSNTVTQWRLNIAGH